MTVYMTEERDECKFTIENENEHEKDINRLEDTWVKIKYN